MAANESKNITLRVTYGELLERSKKFERFSNFASTREELYRLDGYRTSGGNGETGRGSAHAYTKARSREKKGALTRHDKTQRKVSTEDFASEWAASTIDVERLISQWSGSLEVMEIVRQKW